MDAQFFFLFLAENDLVHIFGFYVCTFSDLMWLGLVRNGPCNYENMQIYCKWIGNQQGQYYLMRRRCLISLGQ